MHRTIVLMSTTLIWKSLGNTRVISQTALDHFRTALSEQKADPYSVLLKRNKLPMGLLEDTSKSSTKVRGGAEGQSSVIWH